MSTIIKVKVPSGEVCKQCRYLRDLVVEEIETTTWSDTKPTYIRHLSGSCTLFRRIVTGSGVSELYKCSECVRQGIEVDCEPFG